MKKYKVIAETIEERNVVFAAGKLVGLPIYLDTLKHTDYQSFPALSVNLRPNISSSCRIVGDISECSPGEELLTLAEIIAVMLEYKETSVILTAEYSAKIKPDGGVEVGCQKIPAENIKAFIKKYNEITKA